MRKGGVNKEVKTTDNKRNEKLSFLLSCFWTLLIWSTTHDGITSANLVPRVFSFSKKAAAEEKRISPSLVPMPVRAIRVLRGDLEPSANFPYKLNR